MRHADKSPARARPCPGVERRAGRGAGAAFADERPCAIAQRKLAQAIDSGPRARAVRAWRDAIHDSARLLAQRKTAPEGQAVPQPAAGPGQALPEGLKSGLETLSGVAMDAVKVHCCSPRPAQLGALAYARGREIHLAPGQERHLAHEAWHLVQQAQGRVRETLQLRGGVAANDDHGLEHEADVMGARALALTDRRPGAAPAQSANAALPGTVPAIGPQPLQRKVYPAWKLDTEAAIGQWRTKIEAVSALEDQWAVADELYALAEFLLEEMGDDLAYRRVEGDSPPKGITKAQSAAWQILDLFDRAAAPASEPAPQGKAKPVAADESWMAGPSKARKLRAPQKKSAAQREHEKRERLARQAASKEESEEAAKLARERQEQAQAEEERMQGLTPDANHYWQAIQAMPAGHADDVAAPFQFLVVNRFITLAKPHRAFLSASEKDALGQRKDKRFGLSSRINPSARIANPGAALVLHMHCDGAGKVLSAGIKYLASERLPGANIVMENMHFLKLDFGVNGDNVEEKVAAFD